MLFPELLTSPLTPDPSHPRAGLLPLFSQTHPYNLATVASSPGLLASWPGPGSPSLVSAIPHTLLPLPPFLLSKGSLAYSLCSAGTLPSALFLPYIFSKNLLHTLGVAMSSFISFFLSIATPRRPIKVGLHCASWVSTLFRTLSCCQLMVLINLLSNRRLPECPLYINNI